LAVLRSAGNESARPMRRGTSGPFGARIGVRACPADERHPGRRGTRLLRLRGLDAPWRQAGRGRRGPSRADGPLGAAHHRDSLLPGRARRQDDARYRHPRDDRRAHRHVARLDRRHGRRRRDRDRHRCLISAPGCPSARSGSSPRSHSPCSASSWWPRGSACSNGRSGAGSRGVAGCDPVGVD
jgi:hypothetical protein